ncbi:MAG TPA: protein phosphatase 2C domain-containing protein [Ktedonobacterales bacterium]|nr:protein phosphatase 2C domain-containing protein [Ktedonobacterales bacterium]
MNPLPPDARRSQARAEQFYRLLLHLYPVAFRRTYEREMLLAFRACYRDLLQQSHPHERLRFWSMIAFDLGITVCSERLRSCVAFCKRLLGRERNYLMASALLRLDVAALTDRGLTRDANEDTLISVVPPDTQTMQQKGALFVVADGMGGHTMGEVASDLAVTTIRETYYQNPENDTLTALRQAVEQANETIVQRNETLRTREEASRWMGTTCVAAVLKDDRVYIANAGDSLAYLIRDQEVLQLAQNHSWEVEQVRLGAMTLEEAKAQGKGNVITCCLGDTLELEVYAATEQAQDGDILVLCTDGLHGLIGEEEIRAIVQQYGPEESAARLVARANESGGPDNITAVVARISLAA